ASAAALAATALLVRRRADQAERDHPPTGYFLTVDNVRLHYQDWGNGPPVVLLHGNGAMAEDFPVSGVFDLLARHHRVIAFDRPGFGYSGRPREQVWTPEAQAHLLLHAMAALGIERPVVLGHSWGALVALAMALAAPSGLRGLVLVGGYYYPTGRADAPPLSPPVIPVLGDVMRHTVSPVMARLMMPKLLQRIFEPAPVSARFTEHFPLDLCLRPEQIRATAEESALMIPAAARLREHYSKITLPVAIIAGGDDSIADAGRQSQRLHDEIRHSTLRLIPGAGHMVHYAAPDIVAATVHALAQPRPTRRAAPVRRTPWQILTSGLGLGGKAEMR
ncbi:MAG: alpha/beta hydrolase, partial [Rhodospirillales bacterium]|nr:alpha/beta hydrolase [Rhodospirillales bacterium]